jgi:hypothetical protein
MLSCTMFLGFLDTLFNSKGTLVPKAHLTTVKFDGENYLEWSKSRKMILDGDGS